jgi:glycerol-3-phosphate dehydrogenase (NAD(P)+)
MSVITIVGAGVMGTALCWPACDCGNEVRLVGTHLDEEIILNIRQNRIHPKLKREIPTPVEPFHHTGLEKALQGADLVVSGVSSFGVEWFAGRLGPRMKEGIPILSVTKGLVDQPDGDLWTIPRVLSAYFKEEHHRNISVNAVGGPCIAQELAARRHSAVTFCGEDPVVLKFLQRAFATPYYQITLSTDLVGVEVCAALKNSYGTAVNLAIGEFENIGMDGNAFYYNPQGALFAQGMLEIERMVDLLGGKKDALLGLPGAGDLFATVFAGRSAKIGRLLGQGIPYQEAQTMLAGETIESIETVRRVCRALPKLEGRGLVKPEEFPLLRHLNRLIESNKPAPIPWKKLFYESF